MRSPRVAFGLLALLTLPATSSGQTPEELSRRIGELEARVAALEAMLRATPPTEQPDVPPVPPELDIAPSGMLPVSLVLVSKDYVDGRYEDRIAFSLAITNLGQKPVRAFTGAVAFQDLFERDIMRVSLTIEEDMQPGEVVTWDGGIDYNQFMDTHQRL